MTAANLTQSLKREAKRLGFEVCGACPAVAPTGFGHFQQWLTAGYHGEMSYLADRENAYLSLKVFRCRPLCGYKILTAYRDRQPISKNG